jgi:hypothetical protein
MFWSDIIIIFIAVQLTKSLGFQLEFFPPVSVYTSSLPQLIFSFLVSPLTTSDHLDFGLPTILFHVIFACRSLLGFCCTALHCTYLHGVILLLTTDVSFGLLCGVYNSQLYLLPGMPTVLYRTIRPSNWFPLKTLPSFVHSTGCPMPHGTILRIILVLWC